MGHATVPKQCQILGGTAGNHKLLNAYAPVGRIFWRECRIASQKSDFFFGGGVWKYDVLNGV